MRLSLGLAVMVAIAFALVLGTARADYADREDVAAYIAELVEEHDFSEAELKKLFLDAKRQQSILDAIARPAEKTLQWYEYRQLFIRQQSFDQGLAFWAEHAEILERAEQIYGVPARYIVAIIGVETRWGRITGRYRVLDALMTLGFDYPPRSTFFRKELTQFLLLAREEGRKPTELLGSYAGAMGYGQFIPSSFREYAVDFDGDGKRDIWNSPADAIGSVANYFQRHGWQGGEPVARLASMPSDEKSHAQLDALANGDLKPSHSVADLRGMGLFVADLPNDARAALFRMGQKDSSEYWLGLQDFYVITRYNHSHLYAMAVYQLGQVLHAARDLQKTAS